MIKLFIGGKGSGKTKTLIELVNNATAASNGSVVCIEKGDKLTHDITYKARLIDTNDYDISTATGLYGFIAGVLASNSDITDLFVDSALKIVNEDLAGFEAMLARLEKLAENVNIVMTASIMVEDCPDAIKAYA
ncbi:MAG: ATP-binding protein [Clostridia bacterium]|nr:ATP-binding protein [Clostridia bacterium]